MKPFRVFVTGTDTGVGKTEVSCSLVRVLEARGEQPSAFKPYETGGTEDSTRLWKATGERDPYEHCFVHQLKRPLAPAVAAKLEWKSNSFDKVARAFNRFGRQTLVVEGAGGLFVPVDDKRDIIDVIDAMQLPTVLVARAGLGTLNHVALSLGALYARGIETVGIVLVQSSKKKDGSEKYNAEWLRKRHRPPVVGPIPFVANAKERAEVFDRTLTKWIRSL